MRDKWLWVALSVLSDPVAPLPPFLFQLWAWKFTPPMLEGDALSLFGNPSTDKSAAEKGSSQGFPRIQKEGHCSNVKVQQSETSSPIPAEPLPQSPIVAQEWVREAMQTPSYIPAFSLLVNTGTSSLANADSPCLLGTHLAIFFQTTKENAVLVSRVFQKSLLISGSDFSFPGLCL